MSNGCLGFFLLKMVAVVHLHAAVVAVVLVVGWEQLVHNCVLCVLTK